MVGKNGGCFNPFVPQKAGVVTQKQSAAWGGVCVGLGLRRGLQMRCSGLIVGAIVVKTMGGRLLCDPSRGGNGWVFESTGWFGVAGLLPGGGVSFSRPKAGPGKCIKSF